MTQQQTSEVVTGEVVDDEPRGRAELAVRPDTGLRPINIPEFQAWADSRAEALRILMEMGIAQTRAEDWSDQGGKPYPEQGACSQIVNMVGITISPPARRRENFDDELGHYYIYFLESEVNVPKFGIGPLPIVGRASSRDPFFAYRRVDDQKVLRPASEIDPGDILAKAYTNLRYRAVKASVPQVANITWDDLRKLTSGRVAKGKVKQVQYGDGDGESAATGNCPTCGKGTLVKKERRDGSGSFWACNAGKYDAKTKTRSGCQHMQNDPPAAPADADPNRDATGRLKPEIEHLIGEEIAKGLAGHETETSAAPTAPNVGAVTVMDILRSQGLETKGKQIAALARACQSLNIGLPRGPDPEAWLSTLTDEVLSRMCDAVGAQETPAE